MTPQEAYDSDDVFRLLIDEWDRERRCPAPLIDRCLDLGMPGAANCARWAVAEPDKRVYLPIDGHERGGYCGPYPTINNDAAFWFWTAAPPEWIHRKDSWCVHPHIFPSTAIDKENERDCLTYTLSAPSVVESILSLMAAFRADWVSEAELYKEDRP